MTCSLYPSHGFTTKYIGNICDTISNVIEIRQYIDRQGRNPFDRWFEKLDNTTQARITIALDRLERGNFSAAKGVGTGLFELRLDFGPGYRIFFGKDSETLVILLGGGTKKRQQLDIEAAQALWQEYKKLKREE
jgi:putative addiction module killer protein